MNLKRKNILIILAIVLLAAIALFSFYFFGARQSEQLASSDQATSSDLSTNSNSATSTDQSTSSDSSTGSDQTTSSDSSTNSGQSVSSSPSTSSEPLTDDEWKAAYLNKVNELVDTEYDGNSNSGFFGSYALHDLDSNGIPELIFLEGNAEVDTAYHFFTYEDGSVIDIGIVDGTASDLQSPTSSESGQLVKIYSQRGRYSESYINYDGNGITEETYYEGNSPQEEEESSTGIEFHSTSSGDYSALE